MVHQQQELIETIVPENAKGGLRNVGDIPPRRTSVRGGSSSTCLRCESVIIRFPVALSTRRQRNFAMPFGLGTAVSTGKNRIEFRYEAVNCESEEDPSAS